MKYSLVDGNRFLPKPGAKGSCPVCQQDTIAKCGKQIVWHWAHAQRQNCDPWWENEGPWHREWKSNFPADFQEVVGEDATGEKHIADIKFPNGLVLELQHSAMSVDEMRSREAFYGDMIWIVDAAPFKQNITIFDALPDPDEAFVADLKFVAPWPSWRNSLRPLDRDFSRLMFFRRSERDPNYSLQQVYSGDEINHHFPRAYKGHHLFLWLRPRETWYSTSKPTFFDFGDNCIAQLRRYGPPEEGLFCLRLIDKMNFLSCIYECALKERGAFNLTVDFF